MNFSNVRTPNSTISTTQFPVTVKTHWKKCNNKKTKELVNPSFRCRRTGVCVWQARNQTVCGFRAAEWKWISDVNRALRYLCRAAAKRNQSNVANHNTSCSVFASSRNTPVDRRRNICEVTVIR